MNNNFNDIQEDVEAKKSLKYTGDHRLVIDEHASQEEEDNRSGETP